MRKKNCSALFLKIFFSTLRTILLHVSRIPSFTEGCNGHKFYTLQAVNSQLSKDEIVVVTKQSSHYRNPNDYFKPQYPLHHSL